MLYGEPEHHKHANGLMFGSTPDAEVLTYTQSIFMRQNNLPRFPVPSFEGWAAQGVLMLNVLWTSQESYKYKHQGWLPFTDLIVKEIQRMGEERPIYVALIGQLPHALYGNELNKKGTYSKIRCKSYRVNDLNLLKDIDMWTQEKQFNKIIWSNVNGRNLSLVI
jgi:uracil DNA glycosylase